MLKVILWRLSQCNRLLHQYAPAVKAAREMMALSPDGYEGRYMLGRALSESGDNEEALPYLVAAYRLRPDDFEVARALIICYRNLGEFERSRQVWSEAATLIPGFRKAREILENRKK